MSNPDPTVVQQTPTGAADATDVGYAVVAYLTKNGQAAVAHDHEARIVFGEKKYGQRLKIDNGRDALMDAYQECLDSLSYLMQGHLEGKEECLRLFDRSAELAAQIRRML